MNLRRQIIRGQALSWLLVLLVGSVVFLSINRNATSTNQQKQAQAQLTQIEVIKSDAVDLETGMRGYLLTANTQFLEPFNRARASINQDINTERTLLATDGQNAEAARAQGGDAEYDPGASQSLAHQCRGSGDRQYPGERE